MSQIHKNPKWLVSEFQKSGEFDRLRKQLHIHFLNSDEVHPLMARVEEIAREKLSSDEHLEHKTREAVYSEVFQDLERYPIIERAVSNLAVDKDDTFRTSIDEYLRNIVQGKSNETAKIWKAQSSSSKRGDDNDNDDSSEYSEDDTPGDDEPQLIVSDVGERRYTPSTRRLKDETPLNTPKHLSALNENTSGDAAPRPSLLRQHLLDSSSQSALSSPHNETDAKSQFSNTTYSLAQGHLKDPPAGISSAKTSAGDLLDDKDSVGGSAAQARAARWKREQSPWDVPHLQAQADANNSSYTTEELAPVSPHRDCDPDMQRSDVTMGGARHTMSIPSEASPHTPPAVSQLNSHGSRSSSRSTTPVRSGRAHSPISRSSGET